MPYCSQELARRLGARRQRHVDLAVAQRLVDRDRQLNFVPGLALS